MPNAPSVRVQHRRRRADLGLLGDPHPGPCKPPGMTGARRKYGENMAKPRAHPAARRAAGRRRTIERPARAANPLDCPVMERDLLTYLWVALGAALLWLVVRRTRPRDRPWARLLPVAVAVGLAVAIALTLTDRP